MRLEEIKKHYGTWSNFFQETGLSMNSHQYWKKIGYIPIKTQAHIQMITNGLFKASSEDAVPLTKDKD